MKASENSLLRETTSTEGGSSHSSRGGGGGGQRYASSKEAISSKYAAIREESKHSSKPPLPVEKKNIISPAKVSLLDSSSTAGSMGGGQASGIASKWESMKMGFQSFKANLGTKGFTPLRQTASQESPSLHGSRGSSHESLDEIFQRLKRPSLDHEEVYSDGEDEVTYR